MEDILPSEFHLSQNYPNPFDERTTIKYCLPYKTKIRLEVFNTEGKRIDVIVNEVKQPGTYQVEFNATGLTSGKYFYRLCANKFDETKKMVLMK